MIHIENLQQFEKVISEGVTLVDFYASWCGPCRMLAPIIGEIDQEYSSKVNVIKVDVDECGEIASKFAITAIPALLIFKDNELVKTNVGFMPKDEIASLIGEALGE